jgi:phage terminase large subunit-like protein
VVIPGSTLARYAKLFPGFKPVSPGSKAAIVYDPFAHLPYLPQAGKQQEFFNCDADIVIWGGAAGAGKTELELTKALRGTETPGYVAMVFRRTAKDVLSQGGLWAKTKNLYGDIPNAVYRDSTQYLDWRFPPGSSVSFGHSDNLFSTKLGAELCFIAIDELATDWTEKEFLFLLSRNRSSCGVKPQFVGTCNPDSESFLIKSQKTGVWKVGSWLDWWIDDQGFPIGDRSGIIRYFYRHNEELLWGHSKNDLLEQHPFIYDQLQTGSSVAVEDLIKSFTFISANIYDNPAFLEKNPGYLANLLMMDEVEKKRFLFGNWKVSNQVGIVFNSSDFQYIDEADVPSDGIQIRFWDFAGKQELTTDANSCYTASQKWRIVPTGKDSFDVYILHVFWEQTLDADSCIQLAKEDGREVAVGWELEPGSAALKFASILEKQLKTEVRGIQTYPLRPGMDKVERAKPWSRLAKLGNVYVVKNPFWNGALNNALIRFNGRSIPQITDIIDAGSGCYQWYIQTYRKPSKPLAGKPIYKKVGR